MSEARPWGGPACVVGAPAGGGGPPPGRGFSDALLVVFWGFFLLSIFSRVSSSTAPQPRRSETGAWVAGAPFPPGGKNAAGRDRHYSCAEVPGGGVGGGCGAANDELFRQMNSPPQTKYAKMFVDALRGDRRQVAPIKRFVAKRAGQRKKFRRGPSVPLSNARPARCCP